MACVFPVASGSLQLDTPAADAIGYSAHSRCVKLCVDGLKHMCQATTKCWII